MFRLAPQPPFRTRFSLRDARHGPRCVEHVIRLNLNPLLFFLVRAATIDRMIINFKETHPCWSNLLQAPQGRS
ncbi:hypothetical protein ACCAA_550023 [Candidatus Accumulibacter aalborgensis]|uniref:Uncharacterized protein n=1 Tax=Candidatus Accumulibacter aalborgensis TaxID=1860102 RepID=A0A1A8XSX2_9PROT|nr:hypothetical protein ACCAA_550023 [Candidatus Accumulibacter aalborgensis]